ncbi:hypothetical protein [Myroides odoratimimus]|uniref:hypothetical protein n=1 Tax=Myroides odoratimimus TaxID=76832 RepID=UPI00257725F3|nr:hypothetical protein [Myroides odoratimimus]MDM1499081.1 hypothetical protein [Myroides odoratimimus]
MKKQIKKKKALEKEPQSIWEEVAEQKTKAQQLAEKHKEDVSKKLEEGYTWIQVDARTRKLVKPKYNGRG